MRHTAKHASFNPTAEREYSLAKRIPLVAIQQLRLFQSSRVELDIGGISIVQNFFMPLLCGLLTAGIAQAGDCPNAATIKDGFVLERPGIRSVFRLSEEEKVMQVTNSFDAGPPQTQFFLGGLIELYRASKTGQFAILTLTDLRDIFPLEAGAQRKLGFIELVPQEKTAKPIVQDLSVTGKEAFSLGECEYEVLAVKQTRKSSGGEELDVWTALYAPDLQAVLAKRYDEGSGQEATIGYEAIRPLLE
jgi:hypothetical protein